MNNFQTAAQLGIILLVVNLSCESGKLMSRYDFMEARIMNFSNVLSQMDTGCLYAEKLSPVQIKVGQVRIASNITQNHSSGI